jgi:predicted lipoprotein with Yx(FWY)xxD motif
MPGYGAPSYGSPGYARPGYGAPAYGQPAPGAGGYAAPAPTPAEGAPAATPQASALELPASGELAVSGAGGAQMITDAGGMTLYTYTQDAPGQSNCYGSCAVNWPPALAGADAQAAGDFSLVRRSDGTMQWAYRGQPLYGWVGDTQAGQTTGDGVGGVWEAARI